MSAGLVWASVSNTVKLWRAGGGEAELAAEFQPHSGPINAVSWNHTGKVLATASDDGRVVLSLPWGESKGQRLCALPSDDQKPEERLRTVAFGGNSRYLVTGGASKLLKIWDLKKQVLAKTLRGHNEGVRCATFSRDGTTVASAAGAGEVLVFSLLSSTGRASARFDHNCAGVNSVQFSPFKRSHLASVADDGSLAIWDTETQVLDVSYDQAHVGPASCVRFSPYNHLLLCSAGLDKKLIFYDFDERKMVKAIDCKEAVSAMSFMDDGVTVAVGTTTGNIRIYDLRAGNEPTTVVHAHEGAVRDLAFQLKSSQSGATVSRSTSGKIQKPTRDPPVPAKGGSQNVPVAPVISTATNKSDSTLKVAVLNAASAAVATTNSDAGIQIERPTTPLTATIPSATSTPASAQSGRQGMATASPLRKSAPIAAVASPMNPVKSDSTESRSSSLAISAPAEHVPPNLTEDMVPPPHSSVDMVAPASSSAGSSQDVISAGQADVIRQMINESFETFRMQIHRDVHNMHIDLIRQFQIQQNEMTAMMERLSVNEELANEINLLRAENARLRQRF